VGLFGSAAHAADDLVSPQEEGRKLVERLKLAREVVKWELSTQTLETLFLQPLKAVLTKLESKTETEGLAKEIRASVTKLTDKIIADGKLWDEVAADYASSFSREELEELGKMVRTPVLRKRDLRRGDFLLDMRLRLDEYAPQEALEIRRLIGQLPR